MTTRSDFHSNITNQLISAIESNPGKPSLPWRSASGAPLIPSNLASGNAYNGINILNLWAASYLRGYALPIWGTYRQWTDAGCQVRRGEKSSLVIFYREFEAQADPEIESDEGKRRMMRGSSVFNADHMPPAFLLMDDNDAWLSRQAQQFFRTVGSRDKFIHAAVLALRRVETKGKHELLAARRLRDRVRFGKRPLQILRNEPAHLVHGHVVVVELIHKMRGELSAAASLGTLKDH